MTLFLGPSLPSSLPHFLLLSLSSPLLVTQTQHGNSYLLEVLGSQPHCTSVLFHRNLVHYFSLPQEFTVVWSHKSCFLMGLFSLLLFMQCECLLPPQASPCPGLRNRLGSRNSPAATLLSAVRASATGWCPFAWGL